MQVPPGAVPDSVALTFKYKKNGKEIEFDGSSFPADFDSTYEYIDRYDKIVKKGTADPAIVDFSLQTLSGNDTTRAVLTQGNDYVMLMAKDFTNFDEWHTALFDELLNQLNAKHLPFFLVTADKETAVKYLGNDKRVHILICDGTAIKTAARVNPSFLLMQIATIKGKYSYRNMDQVLETVKNMSENPNYNETDTLFNQIKDTMQ